MSARPRICHTSASWSSLAVLSSPSASHPTDALALAAADDDDNDDNDDDDDDGDDDNAVGDDVADDDVDAPPPTDESALASLPSLGRAECCAR